MTYTCSFCGLRPAPSIGRYLMAEGGVAICSDCVDICVETFSEARRDAAKAKTPKLRLVFPQPSQGA